MRGVEVNLRGIVLEEEVPQHIRLECDEVLQEEEEEEQQVPPTSRYAYEVSICCGGCHQPIKCVCLASISTLRQFETLLFGDLEFLCVRCVREHKLDHGG